MPDVLKKQGFGTMGDDIRGKLKNDNDGKILVVGRNSQTGIGKTTLAIQLCRYLDLTDDEWRATERAHISVSDYIEAHMKQPKGSALLLDEIEAGADSRRATSHDNVNLSQAWATMRAKNIATVATLPSVSMLDNRMLELADYWVLVKRRGIAQPYKVVVNDFNGRVQRKALGDNLDDPSQGEHIAFRDLPANDKDKTYLDDLKDDSVWDLTERSEKLSASEAKKKAKQKAEAASKKKRNEAIRELYAETDFSTTELSEFDWVGVSQSQVSEIINS